MKKFKFSLEQVLKVRNIREKQKQKVFADAIREWEHEKNIYDNLEQQNNIAYDIIDEMQNDTFNPSRVAMAYSSINTTDAVKDYQVKRLAIANKLLNDKREHLIKAQKDRKILEKLKETNFQEYIEMVDKEDQKELDEIAVLKAAHSLREREN